jgi:hypothetical protein
LRDISNPKVAEALIAKLVRCFRPALESAGQLVEVARRRHLPASESGDLRASAQAPGERAHWLL